MDIDLDVPNCPQCLTPMVINGPDMRPFWRCPECSMTKIS